MRSLPLLLCAALLAAASPVNAARAAALTVTTPEEWDADISMRLGEHEYLGGNVHGALDAFQTAARKDPRRAEAFWRASHCLAVLDRLPEALATLEHARSLSPYDPRILNTLAAIQMKAGQGHAAIDSARRAIGRAPRVADVWDTLGWAYLQVGDRPHARAAFQTALRLDPTHASASQGLAQTNAR